MKTRLFSSAHVIFALATLCLFGAALPAAAQGTSDVAGTVKDAQEAG